MAEREALLEAAVACRESDNAGLGLRLGLEPAESSDVSSSGEAGWRGGLDTTAARCSRLAAGACRAASMALACCRRSRRAAAAVRAAIPLVG